MDEKTKNMMPAKNEEDSIEKEVEYCERLLKTIEGMPVRLMAHCTTFGESKISNIFSLKIWVVYTTQRD